jgi:general secretion pathway protein H
MGKHHIADFRGFTLIELMIVLVIMGFVLAFAGPRVAKSLLGLTLKTTAKKIAGTLRYAKSQAVNTGHQYNVILDVERNRVIVVRLSHPKSLDIMTQDNTTVEEDSLDEEETNLSVIGEMTQQIKICPLPDEITFSKITIADEDPDDEEGDEIYQMAFFPNGTAQGAEIILADSKERTYRIGVHFLTGVVSVAEQTDE